MTELIKIQETNGKKAVSARELYCKLGYPRKQFIRWSNRYIVNNVYAHNNTDWVKTKVKVMKGHGYAFFVDYALSIQLAKKLSMMARTETGEAIRDYFISVEKRYNVAISSMVGERLELKSEKFILE